MRAKSNASDETTIMQVKYIFRGKYNYIAISHCYFLHAPSLYTSADVIRWFADRADLIIVMFDAHKLDISDELKVRINRSSRSAFC